jgi:hypothetical protein
LKDSPRPSGRTAAAAAMAGPKRVPRWLGVRAGAIPLGTAPYFMSGWRRLPRWCGGLALHGHERHLRFRHRLHHRPGRAANSSGRCGITQRGAALPNLSDRRLGGACRPLEQKNHGAPKSQEWGGLADACPSDNFPRTIVMRNTPGLVCDAAAFEQAALLREAAVEPTTMPWNSPGRSGRTPSGDAWASE